ncbi:MAG: hypothetical protein AB7L09_01975 [Nitrospira sp.]
MNGIVRIEYAAEPNLRREPNGTARGWAPMIYVNGTPQGSPWLPWGMGEGQAEREALVLANAEAEKFVGDWDVTVAPKSST